MARSLLALFLLTLAWQSAAPQPAPGRPELMACSISRQ
jgi:hypothetical protein